MQRKRAAYNPLSGGSSNPGVRPKPKPKPMFKPSARINARSVIDQRDGSPYLGLAAFEKGPVRKPKMPPALPKKKVAVRSVGGGLGQLQRSQNAFVKKRNKVVQKAGGAPGAYRPPKPKAPKPAAPKRRVLPSQRMLY